MTLANSWSVSCQGPTKSQKTGRAVFWRFRLLTTAVWLHLQGENCSTFEHGTWSSWNCKGVAPGNTGQQWSDIFYTCSCTFLTTRQLFLNKWNRKYCIRKKDITLWSCLLSHGVRLHWCVLLQNTGHELLLCCSLQCLSIIRCFHFVWFMRMSSSDSASAPVSEEETEQRFKEIFMTKISFL